MKTMSERIRSLISGTMATLEKEALALTIEHWETMIAWAKKQKNKSVDKHDADYEDRFKKMEAALDQEPGQSSCAVCELTEFLHDCDCMKCVLGRVFGDCDDSEARNGYDAVGKNSSWPEFVEKGEILLAQLKSLVK